MFGLPGFTVAVMIGVPLFWILYTVTFLVISRHWSREDDDDAAESALPAPDPGGGSGEGRR